MSNLHVNFFPAKLSMKKVYNLGTWCLPDYSCDARKDFEVSIGTLFFFFFFFFFLHMVCHR